MYELKLIKKRKNIGLSVYLDAQDRLNKAHHDVKRFTEPIKQEREVQRTNR